MADAPSVPPSLRGRATTNPSTLHMDGTSPVSVKVQATTDELRDLHNKIVELVVVGEWHPSGEVTLYGYNEGDGRG